MRIRRPQSMLVKALLLALVAVLIVILLVLCGVLASQLGVGWVWVASPAVVALVVGSVVALLVKLQMARHIQRRNDEAVALLNQGQVERAAKLLDELIAASRRLGALHALVQQNRAVASLHEGNLTAALDGLRALDRAGWYQRELATVSVHALSAHVLALTLSGRNDEAFRVLQEKRATISEAQRPLLALPEAVVLCRRGEQAAAVAVIDRDRHAFEGLATARAARTMGLVRSFAVHVEGELDEPERRAIQDAAANAAPHLVRHWSALQRFVDTASRTGGRSTSDPPG